MKRFIVTIFTSWVVFTTTSYKPIQDRMDYCTSKNIEFQFFINGEDYLSTTYTIIYNEVK